MFKDFKDKNFKESVLILTISGILIATYFVLITNFPTVKAFLSNLFKVLMPFIWGLLFSLIVGPLAIKIEKILNKKLKLKQSRFIGAILSIALLVLIIVAFVSLLVPKLVASITSIASVLKDYSTNTELLNEKLALLHLSDNAIKVIQNYVTKLSGSLFDLAKDVLPNLISVTSSAVSGVVNFFIGLIICLYILVDRQKMAIGLKKISIVLFNQKQYLKARSILYLSIEKFTKFFSGKIYDSAIIGVLCFICMLFINTEYAALVAFVIGLTNIIPFFGPIIGAIPCGLLLLFVDPFDALIFVIMVVILQQIDGNIIGPRILGDSVGLSSIWIMFAILVGGAYFGFFGMLLGVPVFSVIYYVIKEYIEDKYKEKEQVQ